MRHSIHGFIYHIVSVLQAMVMGGAFSPGGGGDYSIAILAGGKSSRMGSNKALEPLAGKPVIQHLIEALRPLTSHLFIAGGEVADYERFGIPVCADQYDISASLVGVYSALAASRDRGCVVVACDMPFVEAGLIELLLQLAPDHDAVVAESSRGSEPLVAFYSRSCLAAMRRAIEGGDLRVLDILAALEVRYVTTAEMESVCDPERVFFNVNTPAALEEANNKFGDTILISGREKATGFLSTMLPEMSMVSPNYVPVVCFVGSKNSGKTTLIEKLVPKLVSNNLRIAFIKHDVHGFDMDHEGTDTWRIRQAGAANIVISSPAAVALLRKVETEIGLAELVAGISGDADLVLVEGYKGSDADRIEVLRDGNSKALVCAEKELIAVVSDRPDAAESVPVLDIDDVDALMAFLAERYGLAISAAGNRR